MTFIPVKTRVCPVHVVINGPVNAVSRARCLSTPRVRYPPLFCYNNIIMYASRHNTTLGVAVVVVVVTLIGRDRFGQPRAVDTTFLPVRNRYNTVLYIHDNDPCRLQQTQTNRAELGTQFCVHPKLRLRCFSKISRTITI